MNIKKHHDDVIKTGKEMFVEIRGSPFGDIMMHWYGFKMFIINILILILAVIILFVISDNVTYRCCVKNYSGER